MTLATRRRVVCVGARTWKDRPDKEQPEDKEPPLYPRITPAAGRSGSAIARVSHSQLWANILGADEARRRTPQAERHRLRRRRQHVGAERETSCSGRVRHDLCATAGHPSRTGPNVLFDSSAQSNTTRRACHAGALTVPAGDAGGFTTLHGNCSARVSQHTGNWRAREAPAQLPIRGPAWACSGRH